MRYGSRISTSKENLQKFNNASIWFQKSKFKRKYKNPKFQTSTTDVASSGDFESKNDDDVFEKPGTVTSSERQDSGFVDGDDEQEEEGGRQQVQYLDDCNYRQRQFLKIIVEITWNSVRREIVVRVKVKIDDTILIK